METISTGSGPLHPARCTEHLLSSYKATDSDPHQAAHNQCERQKQNDSSKEEYYLGSAVLSAYEGV